MPNVIKPVTAEIARRHEALYLRLATLTRQAEAGANKRGEAPVDDTTRRLAEDLLFDARRLTGRRGAIPPAAPDRMGLATQLGQALAALEAFEGRHAFWDDTVKCMVWALPQDETLPIARLKPKTLAKPERETAEMKRAREKLPKLMRAKWEESYERGLRDGAIAAAKALAAAETEPESQIYPRIQNPA